MKRTLVRDVAGEQRVVRIVVVRIGVVGKIQKIVLIASLDNRHKIVDIFEYCIVVLAAERRYVGFQTM